MSKPQCSVDECKKTSDTAGMCKTHYLDYWRRGDHKTDKRVGGARTVINRVTLSLIKNKSLVGVINGIHQNLGIAAISVKSRDKSDVFKVIYLCCGAEREITLYSIRRRHSRGATLCRKCAIHKRGPVKKKRQKKAAKKVKYVKVKKRCSYMELYAPSKLDRLALHKKWVN